MPPKRTIVYTLYMHLFSIHKLIQNFFIKKRRENDFRKSFGAIILFEMSKLTNSIHFGGVKVIIPSLLFFIPSLSVSLLIWFMLSFFLFAIARTLRYSAELETVIVLSAYGFLPLALDNLVFVALRVINVTIHFQTVFFGFSLLISAILWIYAIRESRSEEERVGQCEWGKIR